jgi:hypothetical protein
VDSEVVRGPVPSVKPRVKSVTRPRFPHGANGVPVAKPVILELVSGCVNALHLKQIAVAQPAKLRRATIRNARLLGERQGSRRG